MKIGRKNVTTFQSVQPVKTTDGDKMAKGRISEEAKIGTMRIQLD